MYGTHHLGQRNRPPILILLTRLGPRARIPRHTEDTRRAREVQIRHQGSEQELIVGGVAAGVGDPLRGPGKVAVV